MREVITVSMEDLLPRLHGYTNNHSEITQSRTGTQYTRSASAQQAAGASGTEQRNFERGKTKGRKERQQQAQYNENQAFSTDENGIAPVLQPPPELRQAQWGMFTDIEYNLPIIVLRLRDVLPNTI